MRIQIDIPTQYVRMWSGLAHAEGVWQTRMGGLTPVRDFAISRGADTLIEQALTLQATTVTLEVEEHG